MLLLRKMPEKALVVVMALDFCTPRMDMQVCMASITTATPRGWRLSWMQSRICSVRDLEPAGVGFNHAGNLAEAGDLAVGDVSHVGLADERQHVMLTE